MQQPIPIKGGFYYSPERASELVGLNHVTLFRWAKDQVTGYGYPLNTLKYQSHNLIDETDVHVMAAVQKDFPRGRGHLTPEKRDEMRRYAAQVRAKFTRE